MRIPKVFRCSFNFSGIWLFSGFGLYLTDTGLATVSSSLVLFGIWDFLGLAMFEIKDGNGG